MTETPERKAFRLKIEAVEAELLERLMVAIRTNDLEAIRLMNDEIEAVNAERAHFDRWHGPDATFDDSYAARTK